MAHSTELELIRRVEALLPDLDALSIHTKDVPTPRNHLPFIIKSENAFQALCDLFGLPKLSPVPLPEERIVHTSETIQELVITEGVKERKPYFTPLPGALTHSSILHAMRRSGRSEGLAHPDFVRQEIIETPPSVEIVERIVERDELRKFPKGEKATAYFIIHASPKRTHQQSLEIFFATYAARELRNRYRDLDLGFIVYDTDARMMNASNVFIPRPETRFHPEAGYELLFHDLEHSDPSVELGDLHVIHISNGEGFFYTQNCLWNINQLLDAEAEVHYVEFNTVSSTQTTLGTSLLERNLSPEVVTLIPDYRSMKNLANVFPPQLSTRIE